MIYFQKLSFYHLKKAFVPLSIRLLNRYHLSVYKVLFTVCQDFCFHGCMLNFIKMFSASLKWLYLSHQSVKIQITSLIFKNTKPNLYSWCEYIVMMPVLDLVHQYFLKIFVSIFTSQISLNIPFTFARWVFSSLSQNGFTTSILPVTPKKLTDWTRSHRARWWLFQAGNQVSLNTQPVCFL